MKTEIPLMTQRQVGTILVLTLAVNFTLAVLQYAVNPQGTLFQHLISSNIIGFSICLICIGFSSFTKNWRQLVLVLVFAVPVGVFVGRVLAQHYLGWQVHSLPRFLAQLFLRLPENIMTMTSTALVVGSVVTFLIYVKARHDYMVRRTEIEALRAAAQEGALNKAMLQRLQAQIEPHFLFNTLATLDGLIEKEPQHARNLLEKMTDYLRVTLERTRRDDSTLADELHVLRGYLGIMEARLGARLTWRVDVSGELEAMIFPPMLLQPLIENAITHGIEANEEGGSVSVHITRRGENIELQVIDTGFGLQNKGPLPGHGIGLTNVRDRLHTLFGEAARLDLFANQPKGVIARIIIPCQAQ